MKHTFRALAERDFRLYFFGQALSLVGTWVQQVAMAWITYRVTGSAFMLGLITFSGQVSCLHSFDNLLDFIIGNTLLKSLLWD